jgi:mono/diheme cytochrome c family protein
LIYNHQNNLDASALKNLLLLLDLDEYREFVTLSAMKRSDAIAVILCVAILAALGIRSARKVQAHSGNVQPASPTPAIHVSHSTASNPPAGTYVGKDNLLFVNYGTPDPALQSYIRALMDGSFDTTAKGRAIFLKVCAACHQIDGLGKENLAPPLVGSEWVLDEKGDRLVRIVLNGLSGPIRVKDREWNLAMPPWRENLKDDEIAVVLTYVRSKVGDNKAGPIKPEMVSAARSEAHPGPETAAELLKVSE